MPTYSANEIRTFFWTSCKLHFFVIVVDAVYIPMSTLHTLFEIYEFGGSRQFIILNSNPEVSEGEIFLVHILKNKAVLMHFFGRAF